MPDSEIEEESGQEESPVARGSRQALPGTRGRSASPPAASSEGRAFHAGNVPTPEDIRASWVKHKEDWPGLHKAYIDLLGLTYNFVVMLGSDRTRRQHTSQQIATAERQERLWMKTFGAHRQLLESIIYRGIKKCWSGYTEALVIFGRITANNENCAGLVWDALLENYPLDDPGTLAVLMARELSHVVNPKVSSYDAYNIFSADMADRRQSLKEVNFSIDQIFACVELAYYHKHAETHLAKAHDSITDKIEQGEPLSTALVQKYVARALRRVRPGRRAFSAAADGRCTGCLGCGLHCKDRHGDWRARPQSPSSASDSGFGTSDGETSGRRQWRKDSVRKEPIAVKRFPDGTRREHHSKKDHTMAMLADQCHPSPEGTIERAKQVAREAHSKAYLMYLSQHLTSPENTDDDAGAAY